jgi:hypothetical protein
MLSYNYKVLSVCIICFVECDIELDLLLSRLLTSGNRSRLKIYLIFKISLLLVTIGFQNAVKLKFSNEYLRAKSPLLRIDCVVKK